MKSLRYIKVCCYLCFTALSFLLILAKPNESQAATQDRYIAFKYIEPTHLGGGAFDWQGGFYANIHHTTFKTKNSMKAIRDTGKAVGWNLQWSDKRKGPSFNGELLCKSGYKTSIPNPKPWQIYSRLPQWTKTYTLKFKASDKNQPGGRNKALRVYLDKKQVYYSDHHDNNKVLFFDFDEKCEFKEVTVTTNKGPMRGKY